MFHGWFSRKKDGLGEDTVQSLQGVFEMEADRLRAEAEQAPVAKEAASAAAGDKVESALSGSLVEIRRRLGERKEQLERLQREIAQDEAELAKLEAAGRALDGGGS